MTLLVVGGTGFFGKSILDFYLRNKLAAYNITRIFVMSRNADNLAEHHSDLISDSIVLINSDIMTCDKLPNADFVVYAATSTDDSNYLDSNPNSQINNNRRILNFCRLVSKFCKNSKIIYCSSGAVYGKQPYNIERISENLQFQDISNMDTYKKNYALSKRFDEDRIIELGNLKIKVSIARCFTFYGKYLPKQKQFAIGNFIHSAENGLPIVVNTNKLVYRTYLHADKMVDSLFRIVQNSSFNCPIYNVGSSRVKEIRTVAKIIGRIYGVPVIFNCEIDNDNPDFYIPNVDKLKKLNLSFNYKN